MMIPCTAFARTTSMPGKAPDVLLHGFAQTNYSWRHQISVLREATA